MFFNRVFTVLALSIVTAVTAQTAQGEYFIYAPALTDSGMLARQQAAAPQHLVHAQTLDTAGSLESGGPVLTATSNATNKTFAGSVFILKADSLDAAKQVVHDDPYFTNRVWDASKIVVLPYITYF